MTSQTVKLDGFFPSWTEDIVLLDDDVYVGVDKLHYFMV